MNIVFCTDNQYEQIGTSMVSLFEYCSNKINVYLLTANDSDELKNLYKLAEHYNQTFKHIIIDKSKLTFLSLINIKDNCHQGLGKLLPDSAYYRWLIQDYINDDKCLYLDTDVIVNNNIIDFYNKDISNYSICGSCSIHRPNEVVSGVLLMNLDYFRKNNVYDKLVNTIVNNKINGDKINDQYILNIVLDNSKLILESKYYLQALYSNLQFAKKIDAWKFLHYTDMLKPWKYDNVSWGEVWHKYNNIYKEIMSDI